MRYYVVFDGTSAFAIKETYLQESVENLDYKEIHGPYATINLAWDKEEEINTRV
tara:strand:+ start:670 stop:831 length:162 start_codon:yes stop_codon:yes gene_type:complete